MSGADSTLGSPLLISSTRRCVYAFMRACVCGFDRHQRTCTRTNHGTRETHASAGLSSGEQVPFREHFVYLKEHLREHPKHLKEHPESSELAKMHSKEHFEASARRYDATASGCDGQPHAVTTWLQPGLGASAAQMYAAAAWM